MANYNVSEWIDRIIQYGILAVWIFMPLAFGSVHVWAYVSVEIAVWVLAGLTAIDAVLNKHGAWRMAHHFFYCPLHIFMIIGLALVWIQLIPVPLEKIKLFSPETFTTYKQAFEIIGGGLLDKLPLSLYPYATKVEWFKLLTCVAFFELILYKMKDRKDLQRLIIVWVAIGIFQSFYGLLQSIEAVKGIWWWRDTFVEQQSIGTFIYRNHFGTYMAMLVPAFIGLLFSEINNASRKLSQISVDISRERLIKTLSDIFTKTALEGLVVVFVVASFVLSGSRGGIIACAIAMIITSVFLCFKKDTRRYGATLLVLFGLIAGYNLYLTFDRTVERFSRSSADAQGRIEYTKHAWEMSKKFPVTGSGLGTFEEVFRRYKPKSAGLQAMDHAHNDWVELLTETGWGGPTIALLAFIVFIVIVFKKWMKQVNRYSRWSKWAGFGCIVGIIAPLIHATGDFVFRCPAVAMTWFGLMAVTWNIVETGGRGRGQRSEVGGQRSEDRGQRTEYRIQETGDRRQRAEVRGQRSEYRIQETGDGSQRAEGRGQRTEYRIQETGDGSQRAEVRGQRTEYRIQETGDGSQRAEGRGQEAKNSVERGTDSRELKDNKGYSPFAIRYSLIITIFLLILFVPFYVWWGWSVMKHGIAQAYVPTMINSTIKSERVMSLDKLLPALTLEPNNSELWYRLTEATSLNLDKSDTDKIVAWTDKQKLKVYGDTNNLAVYANTFLIEAIRQNPTNPKYFAYFGWIYAFYGRHDVADKALSMAIYLDPYYPEWYYMFGLIQFNRGFTDIAKTFFKMAIDLNPSYKKRIEVR